MGLGPRGSSFFPVTREYCVVDISKGLDGVPLTAEVLAYPVETLSPFSRPFCLCGPQLFDCLVVTFALFVEVRASQHGEQIVRPRKRQGIHQGATNEHCYASHYFRISAGMSPCLINMSLDPMARATSTSRGVKSIFGGYPQSPSYQAGYIPQQGQRRPCCGIAR